MSYVLLGFFGCFAGVTTVLFGFGGGFVVVPVLYQILLATHGVEDPIGQSAMHIAIATSTCVMIVNSSISTSKHARAGTLLKDYIWPLAGFIGLGAVIGAITAGFVDGYILRVAFIIYLAITILDCLFRRGFIQQNINAKPERLSVLATIPGGMSIGAIATFLGVGGSVMTVPLLRRCGLNMTQATSMANPLSLPVALAGTATYIVIAQVGKQNFGAWYLGYVDLIAFGVLTIGAIAGIRMTMPWVGTIPDRIHAIVYVSLLAVVALSMMFK
ncbi:sulfite exporter TauE/SafE family protein [Pseudomonas arsenicoxydans]|uniref:Probable membrane transporter protein n=1 Tax=Pseudomonas arsenicoxydans TaxID=702115 RepID=A0A502HVW1_9PSED|nr:sulfite exporter TauE/SafE family protein [Pseudomonas arsenicoxydans]TPG77482.1 sulfite exporter TauE/SafE family protein [Pseudomonas arsenicoxydans]